jgi:hypothetical protein
MAPVGQTAAHRRHPPSHFAGSIVGRPANRSGNSGGGPAG